MIKQTASCIVLFMYTMLLYRPNNSSTDLCVIPKCTRGKYKFQLHHKSYHVQFGLFSSLCAIYCANTNWELFNMSHFIFLIY